MAMFILTLTTKFFLCFFVESLSITKRFKQTDRHTYRKSRKGREGREKVRDRRMRKREGERDRVKKEVRER
jgi:hypothetical protein